MKNLFFVIWADISIYLHYSADNKIDSVVHSDVFGEVSTYDTWNVYIPVSDKIQVEFET